MRASAIPAALVFGAGRAGLAIAAAIAGHGGAVRVVSRSPAGAERILERGLTAGSASDPAHIWILTVPDDALADVARELASTIASRASAARPAAALHLGGGAPADALAALEATGIATGWMHPMQTLTFASPPDTLDGVPAAVGGSPGAVEHATALARMIGCRPFVLPEAMRPLYHAATAIAANYTVSLLDTALSVAERAGVPPALARAGLARLAATAAERVAAEGPAAALTGPIRRGDVGTVARHLAALDATAPSAGAIYRTLAAPTITLARQGGLATERADALRSAVAESTS